MANEFEKLISDEMLGDDHFNAIMDDNSDIDLFADTNPDNYEYDADEDKYIHKASIFDKPILNSDTLNEGGLF